MACERCPVHLSDRFRRRGRQPPCGDALGNGTLIAPAAARRAERSWPRNVRLIYDQAYAGKDIAISVTGNAASVARQEKIRWRIGATAAALALPASPRSFCSSWPGRTRTQHWKRWSAMSPVYVPSLQRAADRPLAIVMSKPFLKRRLNTPVAVLAVEALSGTLPDDTYLTELRIAEGRIRLTGVSRSVARLVPLLEALRHSPSRPSSPPRRAFRTTRATVSISMRGSCRPERPSHEGLP